MHCFWVILERAIRGIKLDQQSSRGIDKERSNIIRFIALKRVRRTAGSSFLCVCLLVCLFVLFCMCVFLMLVLVVFFVVDGVFCKFFGFCFFQKISIKGNLDTLRRSLCICLFVFSARDYVYIFSIWKGSMHLWMHDVLWLWIYVYVVDNPKRFCVLLQKRGISTLTLPAVLYWPPKPFLEE